ncbi:MAG: hypothetical protein ACI4IV_04385 [Acutalibacteraceae bacterium]
MKKVLVSLLVFALIASFSMVAFAAESPTAPVKFKVEVVSANANNGTVEKIVNEDGSITAKVAVSSGAKFAGWVITGDYEIASGALTDETIVIIPKSDVTIEASFEDDANQGGDSNNSNTSPETGNAPFGAVAVALVTALGAAYAAKRKLSK